MEELKNKKDVLISIIVINFNNKSGLEKTLESIKIQTANCYEVVYVDGGSIDGSLKVADSYSFLFSEMLIGEDTGIYNAMNMGIKKSRGSYLLFLNSGDYLFGPNVFEIISSKVNSCADNTLLFGYAEIISNTDSWFFPSPKISDNPDSLKQWLSRHEPTHQAMFFPRRYCLKNLFDEQFLIIADKKFKRSALDNLEYNFIPLPLVKFSLGGVSSHIKNYNHLKIFLGDYRKYYLSEKITLLNILFLIRADIKVLIKYVFQKTLSKNFWKVLGLFKASS